MNNPLSKAAIKYITDVNGDAITFDPFSQNMGHNPATWTQTEIEDIINTRSLEDFTSDLPVIDYYPANFISSLASVAYEPFVRGLMEDSNDNVINSNDSDFTNCVSHVVKATVKGGKMVSAAFVEDATVTPLNSRTFVDSNNVLHIQKSRNGWSVNSVLQVTFTLQYNDPSGAGDGNVTTNVNSLISFSD